ncbi:MAG: hypothetical protein WCA56_06580 [Xanthobacteraceae bacterium]|jgi:hypothetical protein
MRKRLLVPLALLIAVPAFAREPVGCDKFKWPLDRERTLLASPAPMVSGGDAPQALAAAVTVALVPYADAKLPVPPSRPPKSTDSYAGFISAPAIAKPGAYRVTLSAPAWIDLVQNGHTLQSTAFSGASGCSGIAKSVKFELSASPFSIEISGTTAHAITFVVTPD